MSYVSAIVAHSVEVSVRHLTPPIIGRVTMARVAGKVALVTGGARGIGAEAVRLLVAEGAKVVITDILDTEGEALAAELGEAVTYLHHDVTDQAAWQTVVAAAKEKFGGLDVLVNNAGISDFGNIEEFPEDRWQRIMDINVNAVFYGMKAATPLLRESTKNPSIINISSIAGIQGFNNTVGYVTSKWAVRGMTKAVALDLGPANIRVNSIHPGVIKTAMTEQFDDDAMAGIALQRLGRTPEIGHLIVYLASDESTFCTGAEFIADGGQTVGALNFT